MPKLVLRKHLGSLRPADEQSEDWLRKIANGDLVMAEIRKPRNPKHHSKMFALLGLVCRNLDYPMDAYTLLKYAQQRTGAHCQIIHSAKHGIHKVPKSVAFEAMDQMEFSTLYDNIVDFIITEVLPGVNSAELEQEVLGMVA